MSANLTTAQQKPRFSVAITTKGYQDLIHNTLKDPARQTVLLHLSHPQSP